MCYNHGLDLKNIAFLTVTDEYGRSHIKTGWSAESRYDKVSKRIGGRKMNITIVKDSKPAYKSVTT